MFVTYFTSKLLNSVTRMAAFQRMRCLQNIVKCDDKELDRHTDRWMDREMLDKGLKDNKTQGPDEVHPKYLKETANNLAKPVSILYKKTLEEGTLPISWKTANITPIHKKGPKL